MHSRVIQLSKNKILEDEWLTADDFEDNGFVGEIADYVVDTEDWNKDVEWFGRYSKKALVLFVKDGGFKVRLLKGGKANYFKARFEELKSVVSNMTLEEFSGGSLTSFRIRQLTEEKYSFYVYINGFWSALDDFIRYMGEDEEYYIGGILDYHM